jgi:hypothetical protein
MGVGEKMFTADKLVFLEKHKITLDQVFEGRGLTHSQRRPEMKALEKRYTLISDGCSNAGHRLYDRDNHCIQCRPQNIHHGSLHEKEGDIYIAGSRTLSLLKIGFSKDAAGDRIKRLLREGYGAGDDWVLLYRRRFRRAGDVEARAKTQLKLCKVEVQFTRRGKASKTDADELFACNYACARNAIEGFAEQSLDRKWERSETSFNFGNEDFCKFGCKR